MKTLGIIGGMGPMATAYLLELIIQMTDAKTDQEHLSAVVLNNPQVPDRTAYILDQTKPSPLPVLQGMAHALEGLGCGVLCAPCVTSHYFYEELAGCVHVPFLHMVQETAKEPQTEGKNRAGILSTTGPVTMGLSRKPRESAGVEWAIPGEAGQRLVMSLIYEDIKAGRPANMGKFQRASEELFDQGCDCLILGCTELSLVKRDIPLGHGYLDALEVLAKRCVQACGAPLQEVYHQLIS